MKRATLQGNAQRMRTQCPKGHPYDHRNTYVNKRNGSRQCRTCRRAWGKA